MKTPSKFEFAAMDAAGSVIPGASELVHLAQSPAAIRVNLVSVDDVGAESNETAYMDCTKEFPSLQPPVVVSPPPPPVPTAPTDLTAKAKGQTSIALTWTDTTSVETRYEIYRDGALIATLEPNASTFADSGLAAGTSYAYAVRAVGESGPSPDVGATATTDAPPIIVVGRSAIPAGTDLATLKRGRYQSSLSFALPKTLQSGVDIEGTFVLVASAGATLRPNGSTDVRLAGVTFDGKGKGGGAGSDNADAMVHPGDRWTIERFTLTGAAGYGLSIFKCADVTLRDGTLRNCGSGGLGGVSTKRGLIERLIIEGNNTEGGADSNKFTRMESLTAHKCVWRKNKGKGLWLDYGNSNFLGEDCEFYENIDVYKSGNSLKDAGDGCFFEISGAMPTKTGSQSIKFQGPNILRNCQAYNNRIGISSGELTHGRNDGNSRSSCHTWIEGGHWQAFAFSGGEGERSEPSDDIGDLRIGKGAVIDVLIYDRRFGDVRKRNQLTIDPTAKIGKVVVSG